MGTTLPQHAPLTGLRFTPTCVGTPGLSLGSLCAIGSPSMRGDNYISSAASYCLAGSPLPRQLNALYYPVAAVRFNFTCVGTTPKPLQGPSKPWFTPTCVKYIGLGEKSPVPIGSPPRAWGQPRPRAGHSYEDRFTPTCVGTTSITSPRKTLFPVHPHVRGDNAWERVNEKLLNGSPPRAWGQQIRSQRLQGHRRFTPTCVGTTVLG